MTEHVESPNPGGHGSGVTPSPDITAPPRPDEATPNPSAISGSQRTAAGHVIWENLALIPITQPAVRWREILSVLLIVALADITIFRGTGFAGGAVFLATAPVLLFLASPAPAWSAMLGGLAVMTWLAAARLIWQGSPLSGFAGLLSLIAFTMALTRRTPFVLELLGFAFKAWIDSVEVLKLYDKWFRHQFRHFPPIFSLHWVLPLIAVAIFSSIFVAANPDQAQSVQQWLTYWGTRFDRWVETFSASPMEVMFCVAVGWYVIGALRPSDWSQELNAIFSDPDLAGRAKQNPDSTTISTFAPYRNTLVAVSVLFSVYLIFEFQTLWFRKFPKGFHYSGYAHEGAAWLTVALALATVVLSLIFRGRLLRDPRLPQLRFWAWIWSVENLILALAVYNRLWIYVGFNGMTRMRVVALLGISSVVAGFLLVLWKIAHDRGFVWLLRRHILTVTIAAYLYLISPVDWIVYSYNVHRILAGDPAPAVQITEHYVSPEGIFTLPPLLQSSDPIIRDGIRSLLAERAQAEWQGPNRREGWTSYQIVHDLLERQYAKLGSQVTTPVSDPKNQTDWARFREYAYQWY